MQEEVGYAIDEERLCSLKDLEKTGGFRYTSMRN